MDDAELDLLAHRAFHHDLWTKLHSSNPLERLNKAIKRRTQVVGVFPNEAAIIRLVGALLLEQNDEWVTTRRYLSLSALSELCETDPNQPLVLPNG